MCTKRAKKSSTSALIQPKNFLHIDWPPSLPWLNHFFEINNNNINDFLMHPWQRPPLSAIQTKTYLMPYLFNPGNIHKIELEKKIWNLVIVKHLPSSHLDSCNHDKAGLC